MEEYTIRMFYCKRCEFERPAIHSSEDCPEHCKNCEEIAQRQFNFYKSLLMKEEKEDYCVQCTKDQSETNLAYAPNGDFMNYCWDCYEQHTGRRY